MKFGIHSVGSLGLGILIGSVIMEFFSFEGSSSLRMAFNFLGVGLILFEIALRLEDLSRED